MKKTVSFLTASGFSIPAGLPCVQQLNDRMQSIREDEFVIHSSQYAYWLNGEIDVNRWMNQDKRLFVQEFLKFYNSILERDGKTFHYESFYDYFSEYINEGKHKEEVEKFYNYFKTEFYPHESPPRNCRDRIHDFNETFSQLLSSLLSKPEYYQNVDYINYPYGGIFAFLVSLLAKAEIKFHTLNHDIFFESIASNHTTINTQFSDGYQIAGSPYYGTLLHTFKTHTDKEIPKEYKVKLAHYVGKYDKVFAFYKLHGSIDSIKVFDLDGNINRVKNDFAIRDYIEEVRTPDGNFILKPLIEETQPDFLSGTTNKIKFYTQDSHYKNILEHFQNNLSASELLFVIGYGFQDEGINRILEDNYLRQGKKMVVINPNRIESHLLSNYSVTEIFKSVTDVTLHDYESLVHF